jgi:hypothetical protein
MLRIPLWAALAPLSLPDPQFSSPGDLFAGGPGYEVRFGSDGFTFTPALGGRTTEGRTLTFVLESVRRGNAVLWEASAPPPPPEKDGRFVRYCRGSFVERYEIGRDGLKQSFRFESRPEGSGDLVVRGRISSDLPASEMGGALRFEIPGFGGVVYGEVAGIDAEGRRAGGTIRFDGSHVELALPGEFVEAAAYPLLLDPLVGTTTTILGEDDRDPDVAYDATNGRYLLVWERHFAANNVDIYGQLVSSSGALVGALIPIETAAVNANPTVANMSGNDRFLVAYEQAAAAGGITDVLGRAVDADDGAVSAAVTIAGGAGSQISPVAGGESSTADDEVLVVWVDFGVGIKAKQVTVPAAGAPTPFATVVDISTDPDDFRPAITKHGGDVGRYLVVWDRIVGVQHDLYGRVVNRNLSLCTAVTSFATNALDEVRPNCAGDGANFMVVWERAEGGGSPGHDIRCRQLSFSGTCPGGLLVAVGSETTVEGDAGDDEFNPAVDFTGEEYVVAFSDEVAAGEDDLYVVGLDADCGVCEAFQLVDSVDSNIEAAIAAQRSGASSGGDGAMVAWQSFDSVAFESDVKARRYRSDTGLRTNLGGGCGSGGTASVSCPAVPATGFTFRLTGAAAATNAYLLIAFDAMNPLNFSCGPCTLVPDVFSPFTFVIGVGATNGVGFASFATPIPPDPNLVGLEFLAQWAVDTNPGACVDIGADLSNALSVVIGI